MNYYNAKDLLPAGLTCEAQKYLQGAYLYIPIKKEARKGWGECSGGRKELDRRNEKIRRAYQRGVRLEQLAKEYCLSVSAVKKIIYKK